MKKRLRICGAGALVLAGVAAAPGHAAQGEALTEQSFLGEVPVVLSASRLRQPLDEAPAAITVIDRAMIEASGARELPELLRLVPGFFVGHVRGHRGVVFYHGLADGFPRRMQVLIDGRSIYSQSAIGGVDWTALPYAVDDIERIEVTRGPNSVSYGANSFLGVINIYTRNPAQEQGVRVALAQGNEGVADRLLRVAGSRGGLDWGLTLGSRRDNGFDLLTDSQKLAFARIRADYRPNAGDELMLQAGLSAGRVGEGDPDDSILDPQRSAQMESGFLQLAWRRSLGPDAEWFLQYYHNRDRVRDGYSFTAPPPFPPITEPVNRDKYSVRNDLEFQHTFAPRPGLRLAWGAEARHERVVSPLLLGTPDSRSATLFRLFLQGEWRARPELLLNAGVMYEHNDLGGSMWSPRLAANYTVAPGHTLRIGASRGYRAPNLIEEQANMKITLGGLLIDQQILARGGLRPESMLAYEIGYLGELPALGLGVDFRLFRESIRDLIGEKQYKLPPGTETVFPFSFFNDAFDFTNDHYARFEGAELQLRWNPWPETRLQLAAAHVDVSASDVNDDFFVKNPNRPTFARATPKNSLSLLASQRLPGQLQLSALYSRYDSVDWMGDGDRVDAYERLDLRLAHRFKGGWGRGEVALVYQNLSQPYVDFTETNVFDRRAFVTLALDL